MDLPTLVVLLMIGGTIWLFTTHTGLAIVACVVTFMVIIGLCIQHAHDKEFRVSELKKHWDDVGTGAEGLIPVKRGGLWGYVDVDHEVVVEPVWKSAASYQGGFARVTTPDGRTTYLDREGHIMMEPLHLDSAEDFMHGVAVMTVTSHVNPKDGEVYHHFKAFLKPEGRLIMLFNASSISEWEDGYAIVTLQKGGVCVIDVDGNEIIIDRTSVWAEAMLLDDRIKLVSILGVTYYYSKREKRLIK